MKPEILNIDDNSVESEIYVSLLDNLPIGIFIADKEGLVVKANKKYYQMLEYLNEDGSNFESLNSTVYHNVAPFLKLTFASNKNYFEIETKVKAKCGKILDTIEKLRVIKDYNGEFINIEGVIQDNLQKKTMEKTMRLLAAGVEQSGSSIVITDKEGLIEYVNNTFTKCTGYTFEEVLGKNPKVLNSGFQKKEFYDEM